MIYEEQIEEEDLKRVEFIKELLTNNKVIVSALRLENSQETFALYVKSQQYDNPLFVCSVASFKNLACEDPVENLTLQISLAVCLTHEELVVSFKRWSKQFLNIPNPDFELIIEKDD